MLQIIRPKKELEPFIAYYYLARLERNPESGVIDELCLPSGYAYMGFQTLESCKFQFKGQTLIAPKFYTSGQLTVKYHVLGDGPAIAVVGAALKPTGLWHLFGLDMPSMTDRVIPSKPLFKDRLDAFEKRFDTQKSSEILKEYIEELFTFRFRTVGPKLNMIDVAVDLIHNKWGCIRIREIAETLNVSERYFQKRFKIIVGIVPSTYCRIVRFNYFFAGMDPNGPKDDKSLFILSNYYDFPHFSNDFKKYCGAPPSKFHIEQFHFLKDYMIDQPMGIMS